MSENVFYSRKKKKTLRNTILETRTSLWQGSGKKGRRFGYKAGRKFDRAHWVRIREKSLPAPQTIPPVWINQTKPLKLFVSYWFYPHCSLRHIYLEQLLHRLWMFSKTQPLWRLILYFLSCFHCREMCGVPETEHEQPQPCVPAECHLSRHGVLGVSGIWLISLALWGHRPCSAQLILPSPVEKAWPFLQSCTSWLPWAFNGAGSQSGPL